MSAHNFWDSFKFGFFNGMFNSNPFWGGCMYNWNYFQPMPFNSFPAIDSLLNPMNCMISFPQYMSFPGFSYSPSIFPELKFPNFTFQPYNLNANLNESPPDSQVGDTFTKTKVESSKPSSTGSSEKKNTSSLSVSDNLVNFIKEQETCKLDAFPDGNGYSIGYGHHRDNIHAGQHIDQAQADQYLKEDLEIASQAVKSCIKVPLTQGQFDACTSLAYNMGGEGFKKSSVARLLNEGKYDEAKNAFDKYVYGRLGKNKPRQKLAGLVKRRKEEKVLFSS